MKDSLTSGQDGVAAIIVTFMRPEILKKTLVSVLDQATPPALVLVVNNGPEALDLSSVPNGTTELTTLELQENRGYAGGLAAGMHYLSERDGFDYFWLLDDDSPVELDSLTKALETLRELPPRSTLANRGRTLGWTHSAPVPVGAKPVPADLVLVDGTLVPRVAIDTVGTPRTDLFMMFEDYELSTRLRRSGFALYVSDAVKSQPAHLGSTPENLSWRGYYQTRNHFRVALDLRDRRLLTFAIVRLAKQTVWQLARGNNDRMGAIAMRYQGLHHAIRGRMGKTVDPILSQKHDARL